MWKFSRTRSLLTFKTDELNCVNQFSPWMLKSLLVLISYVDCDWFSYSTLGWWRAFMTHCHKSRVKFYVKGSSMSVKIRPNWQPRWQVATSWWFLFLPGLQLKLSARTAVLFCFYHPTPAIENKNIFGQINRWIIFVLLPPTHLSHRRWESIGKNYKLFVGGKTYQATS